MCTISRTVCKLALSPGSQTSGKGGCGCTQGTYTGFLEAEFTCMTNLRFFQHCDVFLQCLCVYVALISQHFCYFPLSQPPFFFICVAIFSLDIYHHSKHELFYP